MLDPFDAARPRQKIRIELPPVPEYVEPQDKVCRLCEQIAPGWGFSRYGHPDVCGSCSSNRHGIRLSRNWQSPMGGMRDETLLNTMKAVCAALEGKNVRRR